MYAIQVNPASAAGFIHYFRKPEDAEKEFAFLEEIGVTPCGGEATLYEVDVHYPHTEHKFTYKKILKETSWYPEEDDED